MDDRKVIVHRPSSIVYRLMIAIETKLTSTEQRINVSEINDRPSFVGLRVEWDALVEATGGEIFYCHDFIRTWIDNFARGARLRILVGRDSGGKLAAVLPLIQERVLMMGAPVRQLSSAANDHSCRFDLVAADPHAAGLAFFDYIASDRGWDVLRLTDVPQGGSAWQIYRTADEAGFPVGRWESLLSPYVPLPATHEELEKLLQAKFRANLRRRHKRLSERGSVTVERIAEGAALEQKLEEGFALERSGWKGKGGTAISQDEKTRGFYSDLARIASDGGYLSLYFLRVDGRPVAFQYGLTCGDRYYLLKPAYDEALKACSPGQLLMSEVLSDCIGRGLAEFDFLGPDMSWKRDWTDRTRQHDWIFVFSKSPYGSALHTYKFKWLPVVKKIVARRRRK